MTKKNDDWYAQFSNEADYKIEAVRLMEAYVGTIDKNAPCMPVNINIVKGVIEAMVKNKTYDPIGLDFFVRQVLDIPPKVIKGDKT